LTSGTARRRTALATLGRWVEVHGGALQHVAAIAVAGVRRRDKVDLVVVIVAIIIGWANAARTVGIWRAVERFFFEGLIRREVDQNVVTRRRRLLVQRCRRQIGRQHGGGSVIPVAAAVMVAIKINVGHIINGRWNGRGRIGLVRRMPL
jgi:hypothetical protein